MIWDCFTYFNESDLLDVRLHELNEVVDKFVICESTYTHAGNPKALNFDINKYPEFKDKIIYLVDDDPPRKQQIDVTKHAKGVGGGPAWENENHQRDYLNKALDEISIGDLVMVSDLDEFPSAQGVRDAEKIVRQNNSVVIFCHKTYYYMFNYWALDYVGAKIMTGHKFKTAMRNSPQAVRDYWNGKDVVTINSGWHFGWLGGVEKIKYKFKMFAHQEYTKDNLIPEILQKKEQMIDMWDRKLHKMPIDSSFPRYLVDNQDKFKDFIAK